MSKFCSLAAETLADCPLALFVVNKLKRILICKDSYTRKFCQH